MTAHVFAYVRIMRSKAARKPRTPAAQLRPAAGPRRLGACHVCEARRARERSKDRQPVPVLDGQVRSDEGAAWTASLWHGTYGGSPSAAARV